MVVKGWEGIRSIFLAWMDSEVISSGPMSVQAEPPPKPWAAMEKAERQGTGTQPFQKSCGPWVSGEGFFHHPFGEQAGLHLSFLSESMPSPGWAAAGLSHLGVITLMQE